MPRRREEIAYDQDLAHVHDVGFTAFAREGGRGVLELLRQRGVAGGRLVELGCGSGVFARLALGAGFEVQGYDISPAMVRLARKAAPGGTFRAESFLEAELPACDAVVAMGEVLNYLFDRRNGRPGLRRLFRRVHSALRPGGALVFDVATPGASKRRGRQSFVDGGDWMTIVEATEDPRALRLERKITTFRRIGKSYRRRDETHRLKLYRASEVLADLRAAGFRARTLPGYGEQAFWPGHAGFLARRA